MTELRREKYRERERGRVRKSESETNRQKEKRELIVIYLDDKVCHLLTRVVDGPGHGAALPIHVADPQVFFRLKNNN